MEPNEQFTDSTKNRHHINAKKIAILSGFDFINWHRTKLFVQDVYTKAPDGKTKQQVIEAGFKLESKTTFLFRENF